MKVLIGVAGVVLIAAVIFSWAIARPPKGAGAVEDSVSTAPAASPKEISKRKDPKVQVDPKAQMNRPPTAIATPQQSPLAVPRSLEEAFRSYPHAEEYVRRYQRAMVCCQRQFKVRIDDEIKMVNEVEDCLAGSISSGYVRTLIEYRPVPASDSELWANHIVVEDSNLSRKEFAQFMACAHSKVMHRRQPIEEDKFRRTPTDEGGYDIVNFHFAWPIEHSDVFLFLQTGNWPDIPPTPE